LLVLILDKGGEKLHEDRREEKTGEVGRLSMGIIYFQCRDFALGIRRKKRVTVSKNNVPSTTMQRTNHLVSEMKPRERLEVRRIRGWGKKKRRNNSANEKKRNRQGKS